MDATWNKIEINCLHFVHGVGIMGGWGCFLGETISESLLEFFRDII